MICPNCKHETFLDPIVCTNCGYDFSSGKMPDEIDPDLVELKLSKPDDTPPEHPGVGIAALILSGICWIATAFWFSHFFIAGHSVSDISPERLTYYLLIVYLAGLIGTFMAIDSIMIPGSQKLLPGIALILTVPFVLAYFGLNAIGILALIIKGQTGGVSFAILKNVLSLAVKLSAIWVLWDARKLGVRKGTGGFFDGFTPRQWYWGSILLWIIVFPCYLLWRPKYKKQAKKRNELLQKLSEEHAPQK